MIHATKPPAQMVRPRALVIGGSIGGLFAANLLRKVGWDAVVFERARSDLAGRGAGLGTREELFAVMRRVGINFDKSLGADVRSRVALARNGETICEVPVRAVTTAWDRIYDALKTALPAECYRSGVQLECFKQDAGKVTAFFSNGERAEGDLLIGADGIHSTVRRQLMPGLEPCYAGYVAWRGVASEHAIPAAFHRLAFHHMNFCFPKSELALSVPMPASHGKQGSLDRRCQFSWFRPIDGGTLAQMCTDASGRCHGVSIPPPLIRSALVAELKADAKALLAPQIAALVTQAEQPLLQPIFDLESPRITFGRTVLLGDAAFVARPHVGTGVTKAALDAQCLAESWLAADRDIDLALSRYEDERVRFGKWLVARGRYLGRYLGFQNDPQTAGDTAALPRPEIVMREFGSAGVIEGDPEGLWSP
jgi:2-polyprenyl-6-methoxyphenol hydroxylase-like FAD-dependent oxidoreductase